MANQTASQIMLTGKALDEHHRAGIAAGTPKGELVRSAGYFKFRQDGSVRLLFTAYYEEILISRGVMHRVNVHISAKTAYGWQPTHFETFVVGSINQRSIALKVRNLAGLTNVRCTRVQSWNGVTLYPIKGDTAVFYAVA